MITHKEFDLHGKLAVEEMSEKVIEAALDQASPSVELRQRLQKLLTFTKHPDRDKARDRGGPRR